MFATLMNKKALDIGAVNTNFINSSGLPSLYQYTTAYDLAKIMSYVLRYQKLREIIGTRATEISMENRNSIFLRNTNLLLWTEEDLIGGKTGYTRKAMHCFVGACERDNKTVIIAILGSPSRDSLWKESSTLFDKGFEMLENNKEPFVYVTQTRSDTAHIMKASYVKKYSYQTTKIKKKKVFVRKKSKTKALVKKKGEPYAKSRRYEKKNSPIAEQS
jgi:D-alanyl-D-alanine carboxypeptidase (penicillin-binding protein 5/6)